MMPPTAPEPSPMPMPSTELFALSIAVQGWLLTLDPSERRRAVRILRDVVMDQTELPATVLPMWPVELREAMERRVQEAGSWWSRMLDEVEA